MTTGVEFSVRSVIDEDQLERYNRDLQVFQDKKDRTALSQTVIEYLNQHDGEMMVVIYHERTERAQSTQETMRYVRIYTVLEWLDAIGLDGRAKLREHLFNFLLQEAHQT